MSSSGSVSSWVARIAAVCISLTFMVSAALAADPTFSVQSVPVNSGFRDVVTADFDRDGNPDIGTIDLGGFSVVLGKGDGTFGAPVVSAAGGNSDRVVVGDINGDGVLDAAAAGAEIAILLGNGDGTFHTASNMAGNNPGLADFNKDGKLDLAFVSSGSVFVALGIGDGTFGTPTNVSPAGLITGVGPLVTGDFNGDGALDIAFADCCDPQTEAAPIGHVYVLYGNGNGGFTDTYSGHAASVFALRTVDINKDAVDDLAESWNGCHTPCMGLTAFLGNADRQLHELTTVEEPTYESYTPGPGVSADFNADGRNDLAFHEPDFLPPDVGASTRNSVFISLQKSDGTLTSPATVEVQVGPVAQGPKMIAVADFNRDGKPDLVTRKDDATIAVLLNTTATSSGGGGSSSPDFSVSATPSNATVSAGKSATFTVKVNAKDSFTGNVTLTCSGLPANAACTFNPATVSAGGSTEMTITTTGASAALHEGSSVWLAMWLPLMGAMFVGGDTRARKKMFVALALVMLSLLLLQACGGGGSATTGGNSGGNGNGGNGGNLGSGATPPGTYEVVVTATSGTVQHTTPIKLTVQ